MNSFTIRKRSDENSRKLMPKRTKRKVLAVKSEMLWRRRSKSRYQGRPLSRNKKSLPLTSVLIKSCVEQVCNWYLYFQVLNQAVFLGVFSRSTSFLTIDTVNCCLRTLVCQLWKLDAENSKFKSEGQKAVVLCSIHCRRFSEKVNFQVLAFDVCLFCGMVAILSN